MPPPLHRALLTAEARDVPFRHWLLSDVLPPRLADNLVAVPFTASAIADTKGRRETHNGLRQFITPSAREAFPACAMLAASLQDRATTALLGAVCARSLAGSYLRIEYCLDTAGFWLEPHTDIAAKLLTMLIYLSTHPDAENWGTDLLDERYHPVGRASGRFNSGLVFLPAADTWHGFAPRPLADVRRSIIINYVTPDWRSRHELAFPTQPVE
jgi:hypothetical protein